MQGRPRGEEAGSRTIASMALDVYEGGLSAGDPC
jgi:hypothetical protein